MKLDGLLAWGLGAAAIATFTLVWFPSLPASVPSPDLAGAVLRLQPLDDSRRMEEKGAVPARLEPIAPQLHVLRATVSDAFVADLKKVRHALWHKIPGGSLEDVLHECIRVTLAKIEKRRRGAGKKAPASKAPSPGDPPHIAAAVRAEVWERDDGQCAFVGSTGRRCSSPYQVETHHRDPSAKGGLSTRGNVTLFCRAHNALAAEDDFGKEHVAREIAAARARRRPR